MDLLLQYLQTHFLSIWFDIIFRLALGVGHVNVLVGRCDAAAIIRILRCAAVARLLLIETTRTVIRVTVIIVWIAVSVTIAAVSIVIVVICVLIIIITIIVR